MIPVLRLILNQEQEAYLVGGYLRDSIAKINTADIDICIVGHALPVAEAVAKLLNGTHIELSKTRGIHRVVTTKDSMDIQVDFTSAYRGISCDLANRDFTINAIALPINQNTISQRSNVSDLIDPFNGITDINRNVLRMTSPKVFASDPIRLLRAIRLQQQLELNIDPTTSKQITSDATRLATASWERIRNEFLAIIAQDDAASALKTLDYHNLLDQIVPEMQATKHVEQPQEHYWDVFEHSIETVSNLERILSHIPSDRMAPTFDGANSYFDELIGDGHSRLTICKVASLLHDIAKPQTKTIDTTGRIRFLNHATEGALISGRITNRLRMSRKVSLSIQGQILHHLRPSQLAPQGKMPSRKAISRYYKDVGDVALDTLYLSIADHLAARGPHLDNAEWEHRCQTVKLILDELHSINTAVKTKTLVTGHDIMERLSLKPGPHIGKLIDLVEEAQFDGKITDTSHRSHHGLADTIQSR